MVYNVIHVRYTVNKQSCIIYYKEGKEESLKKNKGLLSASRKENKKEREREITTGRLPFRPFPRSYFSSFDTRVNLKRKSKFGIKVVRDPGFRACNFVHHCF